MARKKNPNESADKGFIDEIEEASEPADHDAKELQRKFTWKQNIASHRNDTSGAPTEKQLSGLKRAGSGSSTFVGEQAARINKRRGR